MRINLARLQTFYSGLILEGHHMLTEEPDVVSKPSPFPPSMTNEKRVAKEMLNGIEMIARRLAQCLQAEDA